MGQDGHIPPLSQRVPGATNRPRPALRVPPPVLPDALVERLRAEFGAERDEPDRGVLSDQAPAQPAARPPSPLRPSVAASDSSRPKLVRRRAVPQSTHPRTTDAGIHSARSAALVAQDRVASASELPDRSAEPLAPAVGIQATSGTEPEPITEPIPTIREFPGPDHRAASASTSRDAAVLAPQDGPASRARVASSALARLPHLPDRGQPAGIAGAGAGAPDPAGLLRAVARMLPVPIRSPVSNNRPEPEPEPITRPEPEPEPVTQPIPVIRASVAEDAGPRDSQNDGTPQGTAEAVARPGSAAWQPAATTGAASLAPSPEPGATHSNNPERQRQWRALLQHLSAASSDPGVDEQARMRPLFPDTNTFEEMVASLRTEAVTGKAVSTRQLVGDHIRARIYTIRRSGKSGP
jgi:hypothetical protein